MGYVCPSVVAEPWLLSVCQWEGLTLGLTGCEDWLVRGRPSFQVAFSVSPQLLNFCSASLQEIPKDRSLLETFLISKKKTIIRWYMEKKK